MLLNNVHVFRYWNIYAPTYYTTHLFMRQILFEQEIKSVFKMLLDTSPRVKKAPLAPSNFQGKEIKLVYIQPITLTGTSKSDNKAWPPPSPSKPPFSICVLTAWVPEHPEHQLRFPKPHWRLCHSNICQDSNQMGHNLRSLNVESETWNSFPAHFIFAIF